MTATTTSIHTLGGLILAGGQGRRMAGRNKGLQALNGKPLFQYMADMLATQVGYLAVSANADQQVYAQSGLPVFSDVAPGRNIGPLGGIFSALPHFPPHIQRIQVVACDCPLLPGSVVAQLGQALADHPEAAIAVATSDRGEHPTICQLRREAARELQDYLTRTDSYSLRRWLECHPLVRVHCGSDHAFTNVNDLAGLRRLEAEGA